MYAFSRTNRSSRRKGNGSNASSTFIPKKGTKITPALKKLMSEDGWTMRGTGTKKRCIQYSPEKCPNCTVQPVAAAAAMNSTDSSSDDEVEEEEFF